MRATLQVRANALDQSLGSPRHPDEQKPHDLLNIVSSSAIQGKKNSAGTKGVAPKQEKQGSLLVAARSSANQLKHMQTHCFKNEGGHIQGDVARGATGKTLTAKPRSSNVYRHPGLSPADKGSKGRVKPGLAGRQFRRLIAGEKVSEGMYAGVQLEDTPERESCVLRLGDVPRPGNEMENFHIERNVRSNDSKEYQHERD